MTLKSPDCQEKKGKIFLARCGEDIYIFCMQISLFSNNVRPLMFLPYSAQGRTL